VEKNCNCPDIRETLSGRGPYYESYMHQSFNRPDARAIPFRRRLNMETRGGRYGKPIAQKTVRMLYASVRTPLREIRDIHVLGLLSL
jgi:hypothetical protein